MTDTPSQCLPDPAPLTQPALDYAAALIKNPSIAAAIFGALITIALFYIGSRRNRMEATFEAIKMLQDKDARNARFSLQSILAKAGDDPGLFHTLTPEERALISSIALQFGLVGSLMKRNRIYKNIIFESFASSIVINHRRLRAYARWRAHMRPFMEGSLWQSFDWLDAQARRYLCLRLERRRWRRMLMRLHLRRADETLLDAAWREADLGPKSGTP